jgi:hypothetical protein
LELLLLLLLLLLQLLLLLRLFEIACELGQSLKDNVRFTVIHALQADTERMQDGRMDARMCQQAGSQCGILERGADDGATG